MTDNIDWVRRAREAQQAIDALGLGAPHLAERLDLRAENERLRAEVETLRRVVKSAPVMTDKLPGEGVEESLLARIQTLRDENERLRTTLSANDRRTAWRTRAETAEAENKRLRAALEQIEANNCCTYVNDIARDALGSA